MKIKSLIKHSLVLTIVSLGLFSSSYGFLYQDTESLTQFAARTGHADLTAALLAHKSNPQNNDFRQAFLKAIIYGHQEIVEMFLAAGADPKSYESDDLQCAIANGHTEILKTLIAAGADVKARGSYALVFAALCNRPEMAKILVQAGASLEDLSNYAQDQYTLPYQKNLIQKMLPELQFAN